MVFRQNKEHRSGNREQGNLRAKSSHSNSHVRVGRKWRIGRLDIDCKKRILAPPMRLTTLAVSAILLSSLAGCDKIQSRDLIRSANALYKDTLYKKAIAKYDEAEALDPDVSELYWNRACAAEALVLKLKDKSDRAADRKRYADMALSDFRKWKDRLKEETEDDRKNFAEHRLALLTADARCEDLIAHWQEKLQKTPDAEGLYSVIARTYDETCDRPIEATQWYVKRTETFPKSAPAWYALGVRTFEPLFPEAEGGMPYNDNLSAKERLERADKVIAILQKATELKPKYRDPYVWRAMAHTQKSLARAVSDTAVEAKDKLEAILAREDAMAAWKEQRQVCNIDKLPDCPLTPSPKELFADLEKLSSSKKLLSLRGSTVPNSAKAVPGQDRTYEIELEVKVEEEPKRRSRRSKKPAKPRFRKEVVKVLLTLAEAQKDEEGKIIDDSEGVKARLDEWNKGGTASFDGIISKDGKTLSVQERRSMGCCPPPPLTDEEVVADLATKKDLEAEIASGGKKKRRRRRR